MRKTLNSFVTMLVAALLFTACSKPPEFPIEPHIEFVSYDKSTVRQAVDTVYIRVKFTDGDGDLGLPVGSKETNASFVDDRFPNDVPTTLLFPFIPEQGVGNGIQGEALFILPATCCRYLGCDSDDTDHPIDTVQYELTLRDRAGHSSNKLKLPPLRLQCVKR